jgi:hypothetical protein
LDAADIAGHPVSKLHKAMANMQRDHGTIVQIAD